jgi:GDP-mannose 6-dehydrogenase
MSLLGEHSGIILGLSFKAGTDDLRNSPIIDIIEQLLGKGLDVRIYDRHVHLSKLLAANREYILSKIPYISKFIINDSNEIVENSEVIVVVNKEEEFRDILEEVPEDTIIYDLANVQFKGKEKRKNYVGIAW